MKAKIMKCILFIFVFVSIFSIATISSSETPKDKTTAKEVKKEVKDAAKSIKDYSADQKDEAVKKVKAELDDLDEKIDNLEKKIDEKWDKMDKAARNKSRDTLKELREKREKVAEWFGGLKHGSKEAWEETKKGFSNSYKKLQDSWKKAVKEYGPEE